MNRFKEALDGARNTHVDGTITIPPGYDKEINIIIPDAIVEHCVSEFELIKPGIKVVDPMCGVGTIPRVINVLGGECLGIELDQDKYETAARVNQPDSIVQGDCVQLLPSMGLFDCVFTSLPFRWFKDEELAAKVASSYAEVFLASLKPRGFLLLDSISELVRDGEMWSVAASEDRYLTQHGFVLDQILSFENREHVDTSSQSIIMKYSRR